MLRASRAPGHPPPGQRGQDRSGGQGRQQRAVRGAVPAGPGSAAPPAVVRGREPGFTSPSPRRCGFAAPLGGAGRAGLFVLPFAAPCPGGAGAPLSVPAAAGRRGCGEATPALAPCHLPVSPPERGAPGPAAWEQGERGWEEAGRRAVLHAGKGVSKPQLSPSTPLRASPCVCSGSMPPREKPLPSRCHHIPIHPPSQAGQDLSLGAPKMVLERISGTA